MKLIQTYIKKPISDFLNKRKETIRKAQIRRLARKKYKQELKEYVENLWLKLDRELLDRKTEIYEEIRSEKIRNKELIVLNGIEVDIWKPSPSPLNLFGLLSKSFKSYKTLGILFNKGQIKGIGINEDYTHFINLSKDKQFTIKETKNPFFYKGKPVLWFDNGIGINLDLDINKKKFFADPRTMHNLYNYVIESRLTIPVRPGGLAGIMDFISKNWIILMFVIIFLYLLQTGKLESLLG